MRFTTRALRTGHMINRWVWAFIRTTADTC